MNLILRLISLIPGAVCLVTFITSARVYSQEQEIKFDQITTENVIRVKGLSQNSIYCMLKDSKGFMWIGTWDGLNKYDGYDFTVFNKENGLSNTTINALMQDDEDNIWIGTDYGLNSMNRESGEIIQYYHDDTLSNSLSSNTITSLLQDKEGIIWIGTSYGLNIFDRHLNIFKSFNFFNPNADPLLSNYISDVIQDDKGLIWIATKYGIHCYDQTDESFIQYDLGVNDHSFYSYNLHYVNDLVIDPEGNVCLATREGVLILDPVSGNLGTLKDSPRDPGRPRAKLVNVLHIDDKRQLWVGTSQGLEIYGSDYTFLRSVKAGISTLSISNNDIKCIYQDPSSAIWIGTYKGLNKVDQSPSRFTHYQNVPGNPNSLSDNIVYAILEDRQGIAWIGTFGGINLFDRSNEKFSLITHDPDNPASLAGNKIRTLIMDKEGYIWAGLESEGVDRIDPVTHKIRHYVHIPDDTNSITENSIISMLCDSKGRIWIGTGKGLNILDPYTGKIKRIDKDLKSGIKLVDNLVWSMYEDRKGYFWIGTSEALHRISPDLKQISLITNQPENPNSLSTNRVFSIYEDEEGIFWIGTAGGGLNRYDSSLDEFKVYTDKNGLPNNFVYATVEDANNNLWLTTNWGISKFNKQSDVFVNYDPRDGVQGNEFNIGAFFKNEKGEIYFGGMTGFNVFHPDEITLNRIPPRIVITKVDVFNEPLRSDLDDGEVIRLTHSDNFFAVEFSALDFNNPSKNLFRYRLENYDEDWILANAMQRRAEYRKVEPGTYRFRVIGSNNDGVWNTQGTSVTIIISPPWWKSWLFRISFITLAILLVWGGVYLRISNIQKKHGLEKKMLNIEKQIFELEQKALRLQMNPHFIFNSLNAIQNFVLSNDTDKAVNYLAKFSHLMRMILANSSASHIPLKDELKALTYYMDLERLRFDNKFAYEIHVDPAIDEEFTEIPPMLFQPYVENAIIHGLVNSPKQGLLTINLGLRENGIMKCVIEDNGIGREKAAELRARSGIKRQPRGMIITQERLQILNKQSSDNSIVRITDLKDAGGEPTGTRIELDIHYKEI